MKKKNLHEGVIGTYMVSAPLTVTKNGTKVNLKPGQVIRTVSIMAHAAVWSGHLKRVPGECMSHVDYQKDALDRAMESDYVDRWKRLGVPITTKGHPEVKKADMALNKARNRVLDGRAKLNHFVDALDKWEIEVRTAFFVSVMNKAAHKQRRAERSDTR